MSFSLKNHETGEVAEDQLVKKALKCPFMVNNCTEKVCTGSTVFPPLDEIVRTKEEVKEQAKLFLEDFYNTQKGNEEFLPRWDHVEKEIEAQGTYDLTEEELTYGVKLAWRNAARCIGRIQWNKIQIFDCRNVTTPKEMFDAICHHLEFATNKGNIRSGITVFRKRLDDKRDIRVWNQQLIAYAGYEQKDGTIIGDPGNVEFTQICKKLGWKSEPRQWNILPLVLVGEVGEPEVFDIPKSLILTIPITHPTYEWFDQLGMEWFAVPAVSGMSFDCGGVIFPACPFNGWYMSTEIGCRNLSDIHRYNKLPAIAEKMGLDSGSLTTLWKDKALVELNIAVLHSFKKSGVTIVDHHTASEQFMRHFANEKKSRGGCPADWIWIVPPMSGSLTPVYHQEMAIYQLKPSFDYQSKPWLEYKYSGQEKVHLIENNLDESLVVSTNKVQTPNKKNVTVLYATETGKSESFATRMTHLLSSTCNAKMCSMADYEMDRLKKEDFVLVITSTFGSGEPPENGKTFANQLHSLKATGKVGVRTSRQRDSQSFLRKNNSFRILEKGASSRLQNFNKTNNNPSALDNNLEDSIPLKKLSFAVFGLGSSAYPNFCAFAHYVNNLMWDLGGHRIMEICTGDELSGQDQAFAAWTEQILMIINTKEISESIKPNQPNIVKNISLLKPKRQSSVIYDEVKFVIVDKEDDFANGLKLLHPSRKIQGYKLIQRKFLDSPSNCTINVTLQNWSHTPLEYRVGDHVGVFPSNSPELVKDVMSLLSGIPSQTDTPLALYTKGRSTLHYPQCTLRELLTRYLDLTTPPQAPVIMYLEECTNEDAEKEKLNRLIQDGNAYQRWKETNWPTILTLLQQFPKAKPDAAKLCSLLPKMQPRFYSVSSTPLNRTDELQLTVGVMQFDTMAPSNPKRRGVCSNFLNDMPLGTMVPCFIRRAPTFYLPENKKTPIIMVGPGTGIAPFKGFCSELEMCTGKGDNYPGLWALYHGCRLKSSVLYESEMNQLKKVNGVFKFRVALSREVGVKKTHVQDLLNLDGKVVAQKLMEEGAHIFVCGDANMAQEVYKCVKNILKVIYKIDEDKAENFMLSLRDDNRYHEDIFGVQYKTRVHAETAENPGLREKMKKLFF